MDLHDTRIMLRNLASALGSVPSDSDRFADLRMAITSVLHQGFDEEHTVLCIVGLCSGFTQGVISELAQICGADKAVT